MQIGVVGINYRSSSLALREMLAKAFQKEFGQGEGYVLLSTCNRAELYFCARSLSDKQMEIFMRLREHIEIGFEHALYSYFGHDCFNHLGRVISGVDSAIFGESEIQRQVKLAYESARERGKLTLELHYLFQKGLKIGKEMRTSFLLTKKGDALPLAIQSIIEEKKSLQECRYLFVGNSTINRKLIHFFEQKKCASLTLCTRMDRGACPPVAIARWSELERWSDYDVVICGTYHDGFVIEQGRKTKRAPLLFDLSVPRNIDPHLGQDFSLYNIDQIGHLVSKKKDAKEIALCENVIEKFTARQIKLFQERRQAKWRLERVYKVIPTVEKILSC